MLCKCLVAAAVASQSLVALSEQIEMPVLNAANGFGNAENNVRAALAVEKDVLVISDIGEDH